MKILCVGKSPGFNSKAMDELRTAWDHYDLPEAQHTTLLEKMLAKNKDPDPAQISEALPELLDRIDRINPDIIVPMGGVCTTALLGVPIVCSHGISHGARLAGVDRVIHPIYDPAAGIQNKGFFPAFYYDLGQLQIHVSGSAPVWTPADQSRCRVEWLNLRRHGPALERSWDLVAVDTEGWSWKPWGLSFCADGDHAFVIRSDDHNALTWFQEWLGAVAAVTMHNGIHDLPVLRAMGISFPSQQIHDTQVLAYHDMLRTGSGVLDQEAQNLGTLAYRALGMVLQDLADLPGVDFDTETIPYSDAVMQYAGADVISDYRLFTHYDRLGIPELLIYQIDMSQVPLVEEMISTGMPFDADATVAYLVDVINKKEVVTAELREMAARRGLRDFNPGSHDQVRELVTQKYGLRVRKRTKGGKASTNEKALAPFKEHIFVQKLQTFRELDKLEGTYLLPLMKEISQ